MQSKSLIEGSLTRRELLAVAAGLGILGSTAQGMAARSSAFPPNFLWGTATAGHQVEGSNVNSDAWLLEHTQPTQFAQSSGDACDHYQRYRDDIALVKKLGFNCYRFSLEWSRIEPAQGEFLLAELEHYRRMLASCHEQGLKPVLTFNHFTTPRWFAALGGWEHSQSAELFERFCARATGHLGDLIGVAATFNEPNLAAMFNWFGLPPGYFEGRAAMNAAAARSCGTDKFAWFLSGEPRAMLPNLLEAHRRAYEAIKSGRGEFPVGVTLAIVDDQAVGDNSLRDRKRAECYEPWLDAASHSDFVGVQTYGRSRVDSKGAMKPEANAELTQMGEEFYPEALEHTIRYAAAATRKPVYVTENGIGTADDSRRVAYINRAVAGVKSCLADGIDVRSYIHWSLMDNFEWYFGYRMTFGLVAVDRTTQHRTPKPSAYHLGKIARSNGVGI